MQRDPLEKEKCDYIKGIRIKKFHPFLFYYQCEKCGMEFKNETMYESSSPDPPFTWRNYHIGCSHCFSGKEDFKKWLESKGKLFTYDNYKPMIDRLVESGRGN